MQHATIFIYSLQWKHCLTELLCCELRPYISIICIYFVEKCILSTVLPGLHWLGGFWFIKSLCGKQHLLSSTAQQFLLLSPCPSESLVWTPVSEGLSSLSSHTTYCKNTFTPPSLKANKSSSYRPLCDLFQWRGGAAQTWPQDRALEIFSIAVHFPVVLGRPLNFPHSYPLVQE